MAARRFYTVTVSFFLPALADAAVYLAVSIKHDLRWLGVVITGLVLLTQGLAVTVGVLSVGVMRTQPAGGIA